MVQKEFQCDLCIMSYDTPLSLQKHRKKHTNVPTFECKKCKKPFSYQNSYKKHLQMECHTPRGISPYKEQHVCHICDVIFTSKLQYQLHRLEHGNAFQCNYCGQKFTRNYNLQLHKRSKHGGLETK